MNEFGFPQNYAADLFDQFISANTMRTVVTNFKRVCNALNVKSGKFDIFYPVLKKGVLNKNNWKAKSVFSKLDKKISSGVYKNETYNLYGQDANNILNGQNCLIIGGGPCGLRTAIELQLLGSNNVIIVEKRDRISRNNVVHLWPFVIHDLKQLAGKILYAKFCAGSIDHISIRQLQLMLLKVALILGCDFVDNVAFEQICPLSIRNPEILKNSSNNLNLNEIHSDSHNLNELNQNKQTECLCCCHQHLISETDQSDKNIGAYAHFIYNNNSNYPQIRNKLNLFSFNILIGADGRRNTLSDYFPRKEFRGRLAIAITANFINKHTLAEAQVPEISGISFIYYQQLFKTLQKETGIDLENICYYKDDTHYFVMTAKKSSLLAKNVLIEDFQDTQALLSPNNINQTELLNYANDAAKWTTGLTSLQFALNHYGEADVAMFDFTSMYAAENACRVKEVYLKKCLHTYNNLDKKCCSNLNKNVSSQFKTKTGLLLTALVGDSLLEPFWPTGSGCGRGFLSSMDASWMCRQWAIKVNLSNSNLDETCSKTLLQKNEESILNVVSERESIYRLLAQTKSENLNQHFKTYTINPITRYPNLNTLSILPNQCKHLLYSGLICPKKLNKQSLAEKRLRRITIACTPDTFNQKVQSLNDTSNLYNVNNKINVNITEEDKIIDDNSKNNLNENKNCEEDEKKIRKLDTGIHNLLHESYMTPSAYNLASIEKNRTKEIQNVIRHRKQREEKLNDDIKNIYNMNYKNDNFNEISSEQRFINHIHKQIKSKVSWFLNEKLAYNETNNDLFEENIKQTEDFKSINKELDLNEDYVNFSKRVSNLENKLNGNYNGEKISTDKPAKYGDGINVMMAKLNLQELLDPKKQHEKFQAEVKRKAFLEKDYKFVGKLTKNDWNVKLFNKPKQDETKIDKENLKILNKNLASRPKELLAIFKQNKQNIENLLANGKTNKVNLIERKKLQKFEQKTNGKCGEWIEKLKNELNVKQNNNKQIKTKKVEVCKKLPTNESKVKDDKKCASLHKKTLSNLGSSLTQETIKPKIDTFLSSIFSKPNTNVKYTNENCVRCHEKVLTVDKIIISGIIFHRNCLTCTKCGITLRLNEVRPIVEKNREKNMEFFDKNCGEFDCICILCSKVFTSDSNSEVDSSLSAKENFLIQGSLFNQNENKNDNYKSKLKERMKWKEMFLLNTDLNGCLKENIQPVNERVEYENTSMTFELYDDEEITMMLNLDQNDGLMNNLDSEEGLNGSGEKFSIGTSNEGESDDRINEEVKKEKNNDLICEINKQINVCVRKEGQEKLENKQNSDFDNDSFNEDDEEEVEGDVDEDDDYSTDTTGADFNSDQFDISEDTSCFFKNKCFDNEFDNLNIKDKVPQIIINEDKIDFTDDDVNDDDSDRTLNEKIINQENLEFKNNGNYFEPKETIVNLKESELVIKKNHIIELDEFNDLSLTEDSNNSQCQSSKQNQTLKPDLSISVCDKTTIIKEDEEEESDFNDLILESILCREQVSKEKNSLKKKNLHEQYLISNENSIKSSTQVDDIESKNKIQNSYESATSSSIVDDMSNNSPSASRTFSFKVKTPKLLSTERYSKIPVLRNRILAENYPAYEGSFVEKLLKCKSSPSLDNNILKYLFNDNKLKK